ncbi:GPP34 family phosphoprotein [Lentzea sp. NBRC 102530]|uniref:GOLPH3/VPS74 family protein n=1 Tax=Lentzea sp. NBRC 102530 TaxID=3032201 RepID=UPI002552D83D|nr:GPP34 family phosphoprotein [Lentzea sp. NBRC 102530]
MLPEDLLLLFVNEQTGHVLAGPETVTNALSGGMLAELVHSGRLGYDPHAKQLRIADPTPLPHPFLHESLTRLHVPLTPRRAVSRTRRYVRDTVLTGLEARGVLTTQKRIFGGFVIRDAGAVREVRTATGSVLFGHRSPDVRAGTLISLLHAVNAVHKVFGGPEHELTARAKQIADAQSPAVVAIHAAVVAEMVVAKVAATSEGRLLR